jgi:hypothetical protein
MLAEAATAATTRTDVLAAIKQASAATGSDFHYLLDTAMRESSLKPQAKSSSSSASGLFQFVGQTWLGLIKQHGAQYGLGSDADAITQESDGHFRVDNSADRQAILALRNDPKVSALMEGEYANQAKSTLESSLGRGVCNGELYAAHFLGPDAACRLIQMNGSTPNASAAAAFPQAAGANRSVFYHADGSAKSVREVYDWAVQQPSGAQPAANDAAPAARPSATVDSSSTDWLAAQMFDAMGGSPSFSTGALSQSPFALTPDVMQILSSLSGPDTSTDVNHKAS